MHRLLVRQELLLVRELGLDTRSSEPLVQDQCGDRDALALLDDAPEVARGAPRTGHRIHEHRRVEVDQRGPRVGWRCPHRRRAARMSRSSASTSTAGRVGGRPIARSRTASMRWRSLSLSLSAWAAYSLIASRTTWLWGFRTFAAVRRS